MAVVFLNVHYRSCSSSALSPIAVVHHHLRISFWGRSNPHTRVDSSPADGDSRIWHITCDSHVWWMLIRDSNMDHDMQMSVFQLQALDMGSKHIRGFDCVSAFKSQTSAIARSARGHGQTSKSRSYHVMLICCSAGWWLNSWLTLVNIWNSCI